jgi:hypothetical protein
MSTNNVVKTVVNSEVGYSERIAKLMEELQNKSLTEAENDRNLTCFEYVGIGYGYNFKSRYPKDLNEARQDVAVSDELKSFFELVESMEA